MSNGVWRVDPLRPVPLSIIIKLNPGLTVVEFYNRGETQGNQRSLRRPILDKKKILLLFMYCM